MGPPSLGLDFDTDGAEENDDRMKPAVVAPPRFPMPHTELFNDDDSINLANLKAHLTKEGRLRLEDAYEIIRRASLVYRKEPNLLRLKDPITVCGDVHGQFFDLLRLMEAGGDPADNQYLFLGDYVDRGCFSSEVVFYLFAHKATYPESFYMLRGNHECRHLTAFFNFKDECIYKYNEDLYDAVMNCFDGLPIAATINRKFFCVHGGLSPDIRSLREIEDLNRFREVPREGAFCDLLWSDPVEENREDDEENEDALNWFSHNDTRQCSFVFGVEAVSTFLKKNHLTAVIRAHEVQYNGYKMHFVNQQSQIPRLITIFSAPNYCDVYKNKGACLKFDNELLNIRQFVCSPHPYYLPNFMDVFSWSLPFVAEKVTDMLWQILRHGANANNNKQQTDRQVENISVSVATESVMSKKGSILREKVMAVTKMMNMYKTLRQEQESIIKLKQLSPNNKLPHGILAQGADAIRQAISTFSDAKSTDRINEAIPERDGSAPTPRTKSPRLAIRFRAD